MWEIRGSGTEGSQDWNTYWMRLGCVMDVLERDWEVHRWGWEVGRVKGRSEGGRL